MLKPASDRLDYGHLLSPPVEYKADFAVGTTYSLDLAALAGVSIALHLSEEMNGAMRLNPMVVLESLRRGAGQFVVFCEDAQIKVPQGSGAVFSLLEDSVFAVSLPKDNSFHPKTWLIRYQNKDNRVLYRFIVLSRNLTFDRSWDVAACLEGSLAEGQKDLTAAKNAPLIEFLKYLGSHVKNSTQKRRQIFRMIDELKQIKFDSLDQHIMDFNFCPLGIPGYKQPPRDLFQSYQELLIISPFLGNSAGTLKKFDGLSLSKPTKVLITRRAETAKLSPELLQTFQVFALKDAVVEGEEGLDREEPAEEQSLQTQDIHAKFYALSKSSRHTFFLGSANCSKKAFSGNVEFLLQLHYRKWGFRLKNLLTDLFGTDDKENPFERIATVLDVEETEETWQYRLEKGIKQLCRTRPRATVVLEGNRYCVKIVFKRIPPDMDFYISPLAGAQQEKLQPETVIRQLALAQLGEFYRITAQKGDARLERIIKIHTVGIPVGRDQAIFKTIIKDPETFLHYVAYILADSMLMACLEQTAAERKGGFAANGSWLQTPSFYENMLKIASRDPERIDEIGRVFKMIDDPAIIPQKFFELYQVFQRAAGKARKPGKVKI